MQTYIHIDTYLNVYNSIIHSNQSIETQNARQQMNASIVCTYKEIVFSHKQERNTDHATTWMNFKNIILN